MKHLLIITIALSLAGSAYAACDVKSLVAYGVMVTGAKVCNEKWISRPSTEFVLREAQKCHGDLIDNIADGAERFANNVDELGKVAACKKLDREMTIVDAAVRR